MKLTHEQERLIEENMGLVGSVVARHAGRSCGCFERDDLMQIGAIGLMKAAASYKASKGKFSTYAHVVVRNEITDALVKASRWRQECPSEFAEELADRESDFIEPEPDILQDALLEAKQYMPSSTARGVDALMLLAEGYSYKEIGQKLGVSDKVVANWISRARTRLRNDPRFMEAVRDMVAA